MKGSEDEMGTDGSAAKRSVSLRIRLGRVAAILVGPNCGFRATRLAAGVAARAMRSRPSAQYL